MMSLGYLTSLVVGGMTILGIQRARSYCALVETTVTGLALAVAILGAWTVGMPE